MRGDAELGGFTLNAAAKEASNQYEASQASARAPSSEDPAATRVASSKVRESLTSVCSVSSAPETIKADPPIQEPKEDFLREEDHVSLVDSTLSDPVPQRTDELTCKKCGAKTVIPSAQMKSTAKYEKKIQELTNECELKHKGLNEAQILLTTTNEQLDRVRVELEGMKSEIRSRDDFLECLTVKYRKEQARSKKLLDELHEANGNVRVFCRCRPSKVGEELADLKLDSKDGTITVSTKKLDATRQFLFSTKKQDTTRLFQFDRVYTPDDNQDDVSAGALPIVIYVLDGYNVCLFAYGQTGTGKTYTMEGTAEERGLYYMAIEQLFRTASEKVDTFDYEISISILEVYNEEIRDLLDESNGSKPKKFNFKAGGSELDPKPVERKVHDADGAWMEIQRGSKARIVASNNLNKCSSRSHCLFCITVCAKNLESGECTRSKLWLVDLAGSERLAKTKVQGERLKETTHINTSLSALGDVLCALASKSSHIPYRNAKLTRLLQDSLGGGSKALMFVHISPSQQDLGETLSSLHFAKRVRGIELGPAMKLVDLQKTRGMLEKARQEAGFKDESLKMLDQKVKEQLQQKDMELAKQARELDEHKQMIKQLEDKLREQEQRILIHGYDNTFYEVERGRAADDNTDFSSSSITSPEKSNLTSGF